MNVYRDQAIDVSTIKLKLAVMTEMQVISQV